MNFFDRLKQKMTALRPSEQHRKDDWETLSERLNTALPVQPRERRRVLVLPLLLFTAFLSSNAVWWHAQQTALSKAKQLEVQVEELQSTIVSLQDQQPVVHTDTIYKIVYVREKMPAEESRFLIKNISTPENTLIAAQGSNLLPEQTNIAPLPDRTASISALASAKNAATKVVMSENYVWSENLPVLSVHQPIPLKIQQPTINIHKMAVSNVAPEEKLTHTATENIVAALRPKFFKVGANIGWLHAVSPGLMHEGGFGGGLNGSVGFSRHWSLSTGFNAGKLHYKAHTPEAVLGSPELLMLPSADHHFAELDVTGQQLIQFDIGLRYTFLQPGKPRPFIGLGWTSQTVMPFSVVYEIQHEPTGMIEKGIYAVTERTRLPFSLGLSSGLEMPVSKRFDLVLEANYVRQWKKINSRVPDLLGVRGGIHWLF